MHGNLEFEKNIQLKQNFAKKLKLAPQNANFYKIDMT